MLRAIGRMSPGWPSSLWVERLRTYALEHFGDDLQHVCRRKGPQRFRADVAQRAEAQVKRCGGKLIWSFPDCWVSLCCRRPTKGALTTNLLSCSLSGASMSAFGGKADIAQNLGESPL